MWLQFYHHRKLDDFRARIFLNAAYTIDREADIGLDVLTSNHVVTAFALMAVEWPRNQCK